MARRVAIRDLLQDKDHHPGKVIGRKSQWYQELMRIWSMVGGLCMTAAIGRTPAEDPSTPNSLRYAGSVLDSGRDYDQYLRTDSAVVQSGGSARRR